MDVRVGLQRKLNAEELMLLNCGVEEDSSESLGNQPWIFIRRTDAESEALILWPPDVKSWLIRKNPDSGKDWRQEEKGMTEDEMVGWHHWFNGHEFEQAPGDSEGKGSLACCSIWGCRVGHDWVTEQQQRIQIVQRHIKDNYFPFFRCWGFLVRHLVASR